MKIGKLGLLIHLAKQGAGQKTTTVSTTKLADALRVSQQTASRWLVELEKEGHIERKISKKGQETRLTEKSLRLLEELRKNLEKTPGKETLFLEGQVVTGLGEGKYYMSLQPYHKAIAKAAGFDPYNGTLNVQLTNLSDLSKKNTLEKLQGNPIQSFTVDRKKYETAKLFPATINQKTKCAIIIPKRTHHGPEIIEIIAPQNLRQKLKIKDKDKVNIRVET